jgi:hypothetical protein
VKLGDGRPKTHWEEIIYKVCNFNKVVGEKHFLLECITYIKIKSHFQIICNTLIFINP